MAKRYIDAERIDFSPLIDDFDRARAKVIIMGQPTADVVEVVRCGECTKRDAHEGDEYGTCSNGEYISRNDYCSLGERKTDNEQV